MKKRLTFLFFPLVLFAAAFNNCFLIESADDSGNGENQALDTSSLISLSTSNPAPGDTLNVTVNPKVAGSVSLYLEDQYSFYERASAHGDSDGTNPLPLRISIPSDAQSGTYYIRMKVLDSISYATVLEYKRHMENDTVYTKWTPNQKPIQTEIVIPLLHISNPGDVTYDQFVDNNLDPDLTGSPTFSVSQAVAGDTITMSIPVDADTNNITLDLRDINYSPIYDSSVVVQVSPVQQGAETVVANLVLNQYISKETVFYPFIKLNSVSGFTEYRYQYDEAGQVIFTRRGEPNTLVTLPFPAAEVASITVTPQTPLPTMPALEIVSPINLIVDGVTTTLTDQNSNLVFDSQALPASAKLEFSVSADTNSASIKLNRSPWPWNSESSYGPSCVNSLCTWDMTSFLLYWSSKTTYYVEFLLINDFYNYFSLYLDHDESGNYSALKTIHKRVLSDHMFRESSVSNSTTLPLISITIN